MRFHIKDIIPHLTSVFNLIREKSILFKVHEIKPFY